MKLHSVSVSELVGINPVFCQVRQLWLAGTCRKLSPDLGSSLPARHTHQPNHTCPQLAALANSRHNCSHSYARNGKARVMGDREGSLPEQVAHKRTSRECQAIPDTVAGLPSGPEFCNAN